MRVVKSFREFIDDGTVKLQTQNKPRAEFLVNESEKSYEYLFMLIEKCY